MAEHRGAAGAGQTDAFRGFRDETGLNVVEGQVDDTFGPSVDDRLEDAAAFRVALGTSVHGPGEGVEAALPGGLPLIQGWAAGPFTP
jgi:hypothetical protein